MNARVLASVSSFLRVCLTVARALPSVFLRQFAYITHVIARVSRDAAHRNSVDARGKIKEMGVTRCLRNVCVCVCFLL